MVTSEIFMWNVGKGSKTLIDVFSSKNLRGANTRSVTDRDDCVGYLSHI